MQAYTKAFIVFPDASSSKSAVSAVPANLPHHTSPGSNIRLPVELSASSPWAKLNYRLSVDSVVPSP